MYYYVMQSGLPVCFFSADFITNQENIGRKILHSYMMFVLTLSLFGANLAVRDFVIVL